MNFPLSILEKRWNRNKAYFPLSSVRRYLIRGCEDSSEKTDNYTYIKPEKASRHLYKGSNDGPTLTDCTQYTVVVFRAQWEKYEKQGGLHDLKRAIVGSAAVDPKHKHRNFNELVVKDKWKLIHKEYGPQTIAAFLNLLEFAALEMYALDTMDESLESNNITTLRGFMLIVLQVVKHLPHRMAGQLTRQDLVEKFLHFIPSRVCGDIRNVMKGYIKTYYAAKVEGQKLNSKDNWNLLFTITVMKSFLSDFQETLDSSNTGRRSSLSTSVPRSIKIPTVGNQRVGKTGLLQITAPSPGPKAQWSTNAAPWSTNTAPFNTLQSGGNGRFSSHYEDIEEHFDSDDYLEYQSQDARNMPVDEDTTEPTSFNTMNNARGDHWNACP